MTSLRFAGATLALFLLSCASSSDGSGGDPTVGAPGGGEGNVPAGGGAAAGGASSGGGPSGPGGANAEGGATSGGSGAGDAGGAAPGGSGGQAPGGSGGEASGGSGGEASGGSGGVGVPPTADCEALVTDPNVNWRESSLQTDQEIVECLATSLGKPVGYGAAALGGYDPAGGSRLVVIQRGGDTSVEAQIAEALSGDDHAWIVFDKDDFADEQEVAMYRLGCDDGDVQSALSASAAECRDYGSWCSGRGYTDPDECLDQFFNQALNDKDLPIRNPVIGSHKTLDGRQARAYFRFSGFAIGSDSSGQPVTTSENVILTHLTFRGAGHTEDHGLDPDMIRATGASHDIWIHKNEFDTTGDSAFDVKVGAYDITMSFNRVVDVKRASLHGSSDSREINAQITTTMHHNAFVTRDGSYDELGNTGRRVPLIRRGTSHQWNNLYVNYRKDVLSVRVGARVLWQDNALVVNQALMEKSTVEASLEELSGNLTRDVDGGNYRADGVFLWFADGACVINDGTKTALSDSAGTVPDLSQDYDAASQQRLADVRLDAGQDLVDYVSATAGPSGVMPFNSPLAPSVDDVLAASRVACQ